MLHLDGGLHDQLWSATVRPFSVRCLRPVTVMTPLDIRLSTPACRLATFKENNKQHAKNTFLGYVRREHPKRFRLNSAPPSITALREQFGFLLSPIISSSDHLVGIFIFTTRVSNTRTGSSFCRPPPTPCCASGASPTQENVKGRTAIQLAKTEMTLTLLCPVHYCASRGMLDNLVAEVAKVSLCQEHDIFIFLSFVK